MTPEEIKLSFNNINNQLLILSNHIHNGSDTRRISGNSIDNTPQDALTTVFVTPLTFGGSYNLNNVDYAVLTNAITRLNELETRLRTLGLIK